MSARILVVDDEADVAAMFQQRFRREIRTGQLVLDFAQSADAALRTMQQAGDTAIMLLLSDVNMPGMNGLDLLERVKRDYPGLPVLMITAYEDEATRQTAMQRGADGLLSKPLDFGALRAEIASRVGA